MNRIISFLFITLCSLGLHAATEFEQLEQALKSGNFATVQKLVPAKFDILKTTIDGKNLKEYAIDLRKLHDDANAYDQIAYYLGAENEKVSTPLVVFVKTHVKKLGIACLVALGLYATKKQLNKKNKNIQVTPDNNRPPANEILIPKTETADVLKKPINLKNRINNEQPLPRRKKTNSILENKKIQDDTQRRRKGQVVIINTP